MTTQRILVQALVGALLFWIVKLILGRDFGAETLWTEGKTALIFGVAYGIFLFIWHRFAKRKDS